MSLYATLKHTAKTVLPSSFFTGNSETIRRIVSLPYRGSTHLCNICESGLRKFVVLPDNDLLCPRCGSRSRSRRLYERLTKIFIQFSDNKPASKSELKEILHFSPPAALRPKLKKQHGSHYKTSDYVGEFQADLRLDITDINLPDSSQDLIICFHVLEHIPDDRAAMRELARILKNGGVILIQTPFYKVEAEKKVENIERPKTKTQSAIYENPAITSPEDRLKHFGQEDHVRVYSVEGLIRRFQEETDGLTFEILEFPEDHYHGFQNETIIQVTKAC